MKKNQALTPIDNERKATIALVSQFKPTSAQTALLQEAMQPGKNRTNRALCSKASIPESTFYRWMKIEGFRALWRDLPVKALDAAMPHMTSALISEGIDGNVTAIKLAMLANRTIKPSGVSLHVGDQIGQQLNVTSHLDLVPRARDHEQFLAIKAAMEQSMAESAAEEAAVAKAAAIDVEVVEAGDAT